VTLRNFTIDCNWAGIANNAADGATVRTFTTTSATSSNPTVISTNGNFTAVDVGRRIIAAGIPANSWIGSVTDGSHLGLSSSPVANVPVNATIANGTTVTISEKNTKVGGAAIFGANSCTYEKIRVIHGYGSSANGRENFTLGFWPSNLGDCYGNHIIYCLAEDHFGNYSNPFALGGFRPGDGSPNYVQRNATIEFCAAIGKQGIVGNETAYGSVTPFTTGGANIADVVDCKIHGNTFIDCASIVYTDTGGYTNVEISDNTLIRGWQGICLNSSAQNWPDTTFSGLKIIGNKVISQRRVVGRASFGIIVRGSYSAVDLTVGIPGVEILNNTIVDLGTDVGDRFWIIEAGAIGAGQIISNVTDDGHTLIGKNGVQDGAPDSRVTLSGNRTADGRPLTGLPDSSVNRLR
jgi:hypothetical protein